MNIEFTKEDLEEEKTSDDEDEGKKYKRRKIFKDTIKVKKNKKINFKKPKKARKLDKKSKK